MVKPYGAVFRSRHSDVNADGCVMLDNEASHDNYFRTLQLVTSTHVVFCINRGTARMDRFSSFWCS